MVSQEFHTIQGFLPASKAQFERVEAENEASTQRDNQLQATVDSLVSEVNRLAPVSPKSYADDIKLQTFEPF